MYCVVYNHESDNSSKESIKVYYCKKKKLATAYIKKRVDSIIHSVERKNHECCYIVSENNFSYAHIIHIEHQDDGTEIKVSDTFTLVRMQEILDLKNDLSLRI